MSEDASITCATAISITKLVARVEQSDDPDAQELARRNRLALQQPDRRVSAAFGLSARAIRARDDALRALAQERRRDGVSLPDLAREVRREAVKRGISAPSSKHVQRIIE
jgi:hypothetical protein